MRLLHKAAKQYSTGPWLGGLKDLASRAVFYLSLLNFIQISATFYYITLKPNYQWFLPWVSFGAYFGILMFLVLIVMFLEYKFVIPSTYMFLNRQEYLHQNLIRKDLRRLQEKLERIEKKLDEERDGSRNNKPS